MSQKKKRPGKKERPSISPSFDAAADRLEQHGVTAIKAWRYRLDIDGNPLLVTNRLVSLEKANALQEGEWWIPVGFDGTGWSPYLCLPPWAVDGSSKKERLLAWIKSSGSEGKEKLADDPEEFVRDELSMIRARSEGHPDASGWSHSLQMLREGIESASRACNRYPSCLKKADHIEDRPIDLPDEIWRAIECVYRAGREAERASWIFRGISEDARKGKRWADHQGRGRPKTDPIKEEDLKKWERAVVISLRSYTDNPTTTELIDALETAGVLSRLKGGRLKLKGESKGIMPETFRVRVRTLRTTYLAED